MSAVNLRPELFFLFETPKMKSVRSGFEKDERSFVKAHSDDARGPVKISL